MRPLVLGLLLTAHFSLLTGASAQPAPLRPLDGYVTRALPAWEAPGLAIAVVKDGAMIYANGWGVRELGKPDRVDGNTLFAGGYFSQGNAVYGFSLTEIRAALSGGREISATAEGDLVFSGGALDVTALDDRLVVTRMDAQSRFEAVSLLETSAGKRDSEDAKLMHSALTYHASCDAPPTDAELRSIATWLEKQ